MCRISSQAAFVHCPTMDLLEDPKQASILEDDDAASDNLFFDTKVTPSSSSDSLHDLETPPSFLLTMGDYFGIEQITRIDTVKLSEADVLIAKTPKTSPPNVSASSVPSGEYGDFFGLVH